MYFLLPAHHSFVLRQCHKFQVQILPRAHQKKSNTATPKKATPTSKKATPTPKKNDTTTPKKSNTPTSKNFHSHTSKAPPLIPVTLTFNHWRCLVASCDRPYHLSPPPPVFVAFRHHRTTLKFMPIVSPAMSRYKTLKCSGGATTMTWIASPLECF